MQLAVDTPELSEGGEVIVEQPPVARAVSRPDPIPVTEVTEVDEVTEVTGEPVAPAPVADRAPPARRPAPKRQQAPAEPEPVSSLAAETRLLDRARKAVAGGRPSDALSILREAESQFPRGVLGQERSALRVVALCDAGQLDAGRRAAAAFIEAHPHSALRARVESACPAQ